jgi:hypothetical protein
MTQGLGLGHDQGNHIFGRVAQSTSSLLRGE